MGSRLWTNPPLKPDGGLDYVQLTAMEICEDLTESLLDRVENGRERELQPFLDDLPEVTKFPDDALPSAALVQHMEELLRVEGEDSQFRSSQARENLRGAVDELKAIAQGRSC